MDHQQNSSFLLYGNPWNVSDLQVRSVDAKEALRLQQENNFVILDVRPEAEFKEVSPTCLILLSVLDNIKFFHQWLHKHNFFLKNIFLGCRFILQMLLMCKYIGLSRNGQHGTLLGVLHLHSLAYFLALKRIQSSYKVY